MKDVAFRLQSPRIMMSYATELRVAVETSVCNLLTVSYLRALKPATLKEHSTVWPTFGSQSCCVGRVLVMYLAYRCISAVLSLALGMHSH